MRLELGSINISDVRFDDSGRIEGGVVFVSKKELEKIVLEDEKIKSVEFDVAH
ncbi:MAG: beta-aspartyl-peptidase, partial [Lachnospiraceae bacterium]|nr:beta-aspartyl-peptidase [Lachnospiraceae bacterium]